MREIKFRGKRIDNGEWVYGYLIGNDVIVGDIVEFNDEYFNTEFWYKVDPETVGQYTGLNYQDDNQEVYEDDLCENEGVLYRVIWRNGQFALKVIKTLNVLARGLAFPIVHYLEGDKLICKKVGTAWENLELLKGDENA